MFKKKIRQWQFRTNRRGWSARNTAKSTSILSTSVKAPTDLRDQEISVVALREMIRRRLYAQLDADFVAVRKPQNESKDIMKVSANGERAYMTYWTALAAGLSQMSAGGKPSTVGALFEKSFAQIEPLVRSQRVNQYFWPLESVILADNRGQQQMGRVILAQFHRMAMKIYGRNNAMAQVTGFLLRTSNIKEAMHMFLAASQDMLDEILGRYEISAMTVRLNTMNIMNMIHIPGYPSRPSIPEWEKVIQECQLVFNTKSQEHARLFASATFTEALLIGFCDYQRAEAVSGEFLPQLQAVTRETDISINALERL